MEEYSLALDLSKKNLAVVTPKWYDTPSFLISPIGFPLSSHRHPRLPPLQSSFISPFSALLHLAWRLLSMCRGLFLQLDYRIPEGRAHTFFCSSHNPQFRVPLKKSMVGWPIEETEIGPCSDLNTWNPDYRNWKVKKPSTAPLMKYTHPNKPKVIGKITALSPDQPQPKISLEWIKNQSSKY